MKHTQILFLLSIVLWISCNSCTRNKNSPNTENAALMSILSQACLQARQDNKEKHFDEARATLEKALNQLSNSTISDDSLVKYTYLALSEFKSQALGSKQYKQALLYLNKLQAPIIRQDCQYEYLAIRAHLHQMVGENTQAILLADSFANLTPPDDEGRIIQSSEMIGSAYFYCGNDIQKAIKQLEKAIDTYRKGYDSPYMGRIFSRIAYYYRESNNYEKAAESNQAAINFYENDYTSQSKNGIIMAYGEQANLFMMLNMYGRAMELNQIACHHSVKQDSFGLSDLYRFRSEIFQKTGRYDSAIHYLKRACSVSEALGSFKGAAYNRLALAQAYLSIPDSMQQAFAITRYLCIDSVQMPPFFRLQLKENIGQVLLQNGQGAAAVKLLEEAEQGYIQIGMKEFRSQCFKKVMQAYLKLGMKDKFINSYPYYKEVIDSMQRDNEIRALATANIRFETQKKEQENRLLAAEVSLKDNRLQATFLIGLIIFISALCLGSFLFMRQHALKLSLHLHNKEKQLSDQQLREQAERLQQLIASRQELNNHNEELLRQLAEVQATHEKNCDLDHVMESLQPRLLTNTEEEQFRTAFSSLYPTVLHQLRSACPRATRTDELLCMLIVLKQTNEEISRTLGISRASVLQNRYRLRTKLKLPEGSDLDTEIRRLLTDIN